MALSKTITKNNGVTTSYHKVSSVNIMSRDEDLMMRVELTSFMNEEYRKNDEPIETQYFGFPITEDEENTGARKLAYAKIKELDAWADAVDC